MKKFFPPLFYEAMKIADQNKTIGERNFSQFKRDHDVSEEKKIIDRECQRLMKIGRVENGFPYFKPYYGLTFINMLPHEVQEKLTDKFSLLKKELKNGGLIKNFMDVPPSTYHMTLTGIIERILPDVAQEEVDYYYFKATQGLSNYELEDFSFKVDIEKFSFFKNLVLIAEARPQRLPIRFIQRLKANLGKDTDKTGNFHVTLAYFVDALSEQNLRNLDECLKHASQSIFNEAFTFQVENVQMYYFSSMESYQSIPETELP